ncbi:MAG: hypothetical protein ACYC6M_03665 [Terriglobales bacterium]
MDNLSGKDFGPVFESAYDPRAGLRSGGTTDRIRHRLVIEERQKLERQGFEAVTLVNQHTFALRVYLGDLGTVEVPACPPGEPFVTAEIRNYRISMRDMGDGGFAPVSVLPIELAQEVLREYAETGGVFWYRGGGPPPEDSLATARERQLLWYRREYQKAVDAWSRYHQHKFITDRQRDAARALHAVGEIAALPEWVTVTREQSTVASCPACGEDVKRAARLCRHCGFALDAAWLAANGDRAPKPAARKAERRAAK